MSNQKSNIISQIWKLHLKLKSKNEDIDTKYILLTLFFLKHLSDKFGNKSRSKYTIPNTALFSFIYKKIKSDNAIQLLNDAITDLEQANPKKLENISYYLFFSDSILIDFKVVLKSYLDFDLEDEVEVLDIYTSLLVKFSEEDSTNEGDFYTPIEVSKLLAALVQTDEKPKYIYDPCCGTASSLIHAMNGNQKVHLFGHEINKEISALSFITFILHQAKFTLSNSDSLNTPFNEQEQLKEFDSIIACPPLTKKHWNVIKDDPYGRFHRGIPKESKSHFAFISHIVEALNEKGKAAIIVPNGVLFREGVELKIRTALIEENLIEAVIGLPSNLFFYRNIAAAIIVINKNKTHKNILFIDASKDYQAKPGRNILRTKDIEKILTTYQNFETIEEYSYQADDTDLYYSGYDFTVTEYTLYHDPYTVLETDNIDYLEQNIDTFEKEIITIQSKLKEITKKLLSNQ